MATTSQIPIGLKLPLQRGTNGFFNQNFNTIDQAYSNIKNLLLTMVGERRMNVNFGSPIYKLVFEQITNEQDLIDSLTEQIQKLMTLYFPYVDVKSISIDIPSNNENRIDISMTFQLKNSSNIRFGVAETRTVDISVNTTV